VGPERSEFAAAAGVFSIQNLSSSVPLCELCGSNSFEGHAAAIASFRSAGGGMTSASDSTSTPLTTSL
jgi:hypothetical protein